MGFLFWDDEDEYYSYMGVSPLMDPDYNWFKKARSFAILNKIRNDLDAKDFVALFKTRGYIQLNKWYLGRKYIDEPQPSVTVRGYGIDLSSKDKIKTLLGTTRDATIENVVVCKPNVKYYSYFKLQNSIGLDVSTATATINNIEYEVTAVNYNSTDYKTTVTLVSSDRKRTKKYEIKIPQGKNWYFIKYHFTDEGTLRYAFLNGDKEDTQNLYTNKQYKFSNLEALPIMILRHDKNNLINAEKKDLNSLMTKTRYKGTMKLFRRMGLSLEDITDGINDANNKGEFTEVFLIMGVRPKDVNRGTSRYLYNFFTYIHNRIPATNLTVGYKGDREWSYRVRVRVESCKPETYKNKSTSGARISTISWNRNPVYTLKGKIKNGIAHKVVTEKYVTHCEKHFKITRRDDDSNKCNYEYYCIIETILKTSKGNVTIGKYKRGTKKVYNEVLLGYAYDETKNTYRPYGVLYEINDGLLGLDEKYILYNNRTYSDLYPKGSGKWKTWEIGYWHKEYDKVLYEREVLDPSDPESKSYIIEYYYGEGDRDYTSHMVGKTRKSGDGSYLTHTRTYTAIYLYKQIEPNLLELTIISELNASVLVRKPDGAWDISHNARNDACVIPIFKKFLNKLGPVDRAALFETCMLLEVHAYHHEEIEWYNTEGFIRSFVRPFKFAINMAIGGFIGSAFGPLGAFIGATVGGVAITAIQEAIAQTDNMILNVAFTGVLVVISLGASAYSNGIQISVSSLGSLSFKIACQVVSAIADIVAKMTFNPQEVAEELESIQNKYETRREAAEEAHHLLAQYDNIDPRDYWDMVINDNNSNLAFPMSKEMFMYIALDLTTDMDYYVANFVKDTVTDYPDSQRQLSV